MFDCSASMVIYENSPNVIKKTAVSFLDTECKVKLSVIDNSPTPVLKSVFDGLPVLYHFYGENVGYGRGHNWSIFNSEKSRYHLILNPDVVITPGTINALVRFMDANEDVGMVCPKLLNEDGSVQHQNKRYTTVYDLFLRRFLPQRIKPLFQQRLDYYEMKDIGYNSIYDVPFVTGAFMFCRSSALRKVGGFDPRYFLNFEDADLTRKFHLHNFRTVFYPHASVTHLWGREPHKSIKMALIMMVNGCRYFNKWGWKLY
ncbi:glycosyl transferase [Desulfoluna limicola]|uniref:Glycosyl transferase n=1 Tax=Desulfoluna limicola TaxID=2810562 RepID=A0ABN6F5B5_9BACT|nr:glycosyltransferase family 2 protein [Desulfoluna limicola]BCS96472.1 glycosyl transferase [Desulfoluna limicola]